MGTDASVVETGKEAGDDPGMDLANGKDAESETPAVLGWDNEANIYLRLFRAKQDISRIEKDAQATITTRKGGKFSYDYITHDQVALKSRDVFAKHGILPWPTVLERQDDGNKTKLRVQVDFINVDAPEDRLVSEVWGDGVDESDKGPGKAYSYAMKNLILKALQLNTGEDIEADDTKHKRQPSDSALAKETAGVKDAVRSWADNFKMAIDGATLLSDLKDLRTNNRNMLLSDDVPQVTKDFFHDLLEQKAGLLTADKEGSEG